MRKYRLLTPGPVPVPERIRRAMAGTLLHHRAPDFLPVFHEVRVGLQRVFGTERQVLLLASSGTGAMEAAVTNLTRPGDTAVVVRAGKFGDRWFELCRAYGVEALSVDVEWGRAVDPDELAAVLRAKRGVRAVFAQASETSTGVLHPMEPVARAVADNSEALLVVDGISAVGVHPLPMDAWGIDALLSGSQKSWQLPPGLAMIALSERAEAALERGGHARYYFDLRKELRGQPTGATAYSPALALIVGLAESLRMLFEDGLERSYARHAELAEMTRDGVRALGMALLAASAPSNACTAVRVPRQLDAGKLLSQLRDHHGVTLAGGQGQLSGKILRIGHMGDLDTYDMLAGLAALELTLLDFGVPIELGAGVHSALNRMRVGVSASAPQETEGRNPWRAS